ncbi:MAG: hypothetical protein ACLS9K_04970 [Lachnospira eligens]
MIPKNNSRYYCSSSGNILAAILLFQLMKLWILRQTLEKFTKENEQLQMYARRMEITATFAEEEFNKKKEQFMAAVAEEEDSYLRELIEDTAILQVLLRES